MVIKPVLPIVFLLASFSLYAQQGGWQNGNEPSTLSVFSENGAQFFLVLNGINQNNVPVSKIRVEQLPQYGNEVQILFADNRTPEIRKRINIADPVDGRAVNMTLKIVRDRDGYAKLRFHKCVEVDRNYHPERDEYVMHYGKPQQNMRVVTPPSRYNDPPPPGPAAMDGGTFNEAKQTIKNAAFEETKLSTAKSILGSNYVNTNQVMEICDLFPSDGTRLEFAKFAYDRTVDQNNYFKVGNKLYFSSSKEELNNFISSSHK